MRRCETELFAVQLAGPKAEAYARSVAFMDLEAGNYILVDGEKLRLTKPLSKEDVSESVLLKAQYADLVWAIQAAYLAGAV